MVWLPLPARRHRDKHAAKVRDDLDADDLRIAYLPDAGFAGSALAPLALAGQSDFAAGARIRPPGRAAAPALHEDTHAAEGDSFRPPRYVYRDGPASARRVRVAVLPEHKAWPPAGPAARPAWALRAAPAARPAGAIPAPRTRWTALAFWTTRAFRTPRPLWTTRAFWSTTRTFWSTTRTSLAARAAGWAATWVTGAGCVTRGVARDTGRMDRQR